MGKRFLKFFYFCAREWTTIIHCIEIHFESIDRPLDFATKVREALNTLTAQA